MRAHIDESIVVLTREHDRQVTANGKWEIGVHETGETDDVFNWRSPFSVLSSTGRAGTLCAYCTPYTFDIFKQIHTIRSIELNEASYHEFMVGQTHTGRCFRSNSVFQFSFFFIFFFVFYRIFPL